MQQENEFKRIFLRWLKNHNLYEAWVDDMKSNNWSQIPKLFFQEVKHYAYISASFATLYYKDRINWNMINAEWMLYCCMLQPMLFPVVDKAYKDMVVTDDRIKEMYRKIEKMYDKVSTVI